MKIVHVVPSYLPATRYGGPIVAVHALCRALARAGCAVEVLTTDADGDGSSGAPLDRAVSLDGVTVRYFPRRRPRRLYYAPGMLAPLEEALSGDCVLHLHSVFLWPTMAAGRLARRRGIPYVVSPRGMLVPELILGRSALPKMAWILAYERRAIAAAAALHLTSAREKEDIERVPLLRLPPIEIVPNGVEVPDDGAPDTPRENVIVYVGRLSWKKRIELIIDALALLPETRLVIAGPDDEGLAPRLEDRARAAGLRDRVTFAGPVDAPGRDALLRRAAALVLPSIQENFGNVVLEAMALGCPAVVTPGVGAAEVVRACGGGVVAEETASALAAAVSGILGDEAAARRMGERAREHVRAHHAWSAVAPRMMELYRRAAEAHAR